MRRLAALTLALAASPLAAQEEPKDYSGTYYCAPKITVGMYFDETSNKWSISSLKDERSFIIKAEYDRGGNNYKIMFRREGTQDEYHCANFGPSTSSGNIRCEVYGTLLYRFSLDSGQFLEATFLGYIDGDPPKGTPSISSGYCTKIQ